MKNKKAFRSLRRQFGLITALTVLVILVMASVFFFQAQQLTERKTTSFVHTMLTQLGDRLDRIGAEMVYVGDSVYSNATLQQYLHATTAAKRMEYGKTFIDFTSSLLNHSSTVSYIVVVNANQSILSASEQNIVALDYLDEQYGLFSADNLSSGFFGPAFDTFTNSNLFAYVRPVFNTRLGAQFNEKLGTCVVFARVDLLNSALSSSLFTPNTMLLLADSNSQVISCTTNKNDLLSRLPPSILSQCGDPDDAHRAIRIDGATHLVDSLEIGAMGWRLVSIVPEHEISIDLMPLLWLGMLICVIFSVLTAAWSIHIHHYITAPLTRLTAFIENDLDDKLQNRIHISTNSEMEVFCQEINTLLDKVSEMTATNIRNQTHMYELSLAKKRAEFSALQSQINPHFLYNTLDCLCGYGYMLNSPEVVSITNALSSIMRYCIKGSDTVALRDELTIVSRYLDIIRIRFANRFSFVFDIDEDLLRLSIPRVSLQPLVENAIYHGLESKASPGTLTISCHQTAEGDCALCVADDGVGIPPDKLRDIQAKLRDKTLRDVLHTPAGNSLALVNIHNRLRNHYGDGYGLSVCCPEEGGTRVTMLIPCTLTSIIDSQ